LNANTLASIESTYEPNFSLTSENDVQVKVENVEETHKLDEYPPQKEVVEVKVEEVEESLKFDPSAYSIKPEYAAQIPVASVESSHISNPSTNSMQLKDVAQATASNVENQSNTSITPLSAGIIQNRSSRIEKLLDYDRQVCLHS